MKTREEAIARCARIYPLGSTWHHPGLGKVVRVVGYDVARSPKDSYCGETYIASPRIHDGCREWSCYSPHCDLESVEPVSAKDYEDEDDLDFAMIDLPARAGPCKAVSAPEMDPVEARLHRDAAAAPYRAAALRARGEKGAE